MEVKAVTCPECCMAFTVNDSITKVTCNYCGAVFNIIPTNKDFLSDEKDEMNAGFYFDKAVAALTPEVTTLLDASNILTAQNYLNSFNDYYEAICESFKYFEKAYNLYDGDKKELLLKYAEVFSTKIKENVGKNNFNLLKGSQLENVIYLYVAFAVPSILKFETEYSDILADFLLQTWNLERKNRKVSKSTFEDIQKGFKSKLCFITTAVCRTLGLPDSCYELQAFREFRDDYLLKQAGGKEQVQEYYLIAPLIVKAIDVSPEKERIYHSIWGDYLSKCLVMYEQHNYQQCRNTYTEMVNVLRDEWL
jgi:hypothetical protein